MKYCYNEYEINLLLLIMNINECAIFLLVIHECRKVLISGMKCFSLLRILTNFYRKWEMINFIMYAPHHIRTLKSFRINKYVALIHIPFYFFNFLDVMRMPSWCCICTLFDWIACPYNAFCNFLCYFQLMICLQ